MRVCSVAGCPTIYDGPATRCPRHETAAKQKHWAKTRAYSTREHRTFRDAVLARDTYCVICHMQLATIADHYPTSRVDLIAGGLDPNDPQYGRGLCKTDHDRHTARSHPAGWADPHQ
jgi:5-methylcytosine-specific restriction protein A